VISLRDVSTIVITLLGVVLGLTHLRGRKWLRIGYQVVVICWMGLMNGDMVSQALLLGWAQSGIPWQNAFGLTLLTVAALLVPISTGRNVYCAQICPHGAVQQLVRRRLPWQAKLSPRILAGLRYLPLLLIVWVVAIGLLHLPFSPVDIEPFDAWLWSIAGVATIVVAVAGLVASLFIPMAYCRFGCPTGAVLDYIGGGGKNWNRRDTFVLILVVTSFLASVVR
jgi:polyferredoxin